MLLIVNAIMSPIETKHNEVNTIKIIDIKIPKESPIMPMAKLNASIMRAVIVPTVAPPNIFPTTMLVLETGATNISFKNPNCLSQITDTPEEVELNKIIIPITPGARNGR